MSIFSEKPVPCPHCGDVQRRSIAVSVNGSRRGGTLRKAILADEFQRFACDVCGEVFEVDAPFIYLDFDRKQWIGVYPRTWIKRWREVEVEPEAAFRRNVLESAPP